MNNFNFSFHAINHLTVITDPSGVSSAAGAPPQINEAPVDIAAAPGLAPLPHHGATYSDPMPAAPITTWLPSALPTVHPSNGLTIPVDISALPSDPNQPQVIPCAVPEPLQDSPIDTTEYKSFPLTKHGVQRIRRWGKTKVEITFPFTTITDTWTKVNEWIQWRRAKLRRDHARKMQQCPAGYTPAQVETWAWGLNERLWSDYEALQGMLMDVATLENGIMEVYCISEGEHKFWVEMALPAQAARR